jgi:hypothetical protein
MPESVRNRCTKAHEYIFLLTQSEDYFYDAEAIKDTSSDTNSGRKQALTVHGTSVSRDTVPADTRIGSPYANQSKHRGLRGVGTTMASDDPTSRNKRSVWSVDDEAALFQWLSANDPDLLALFLEESRGKSDVWNVPSYAYPGAHFATFPPRLIEPCILAGTSEKGCCSECGKPWRRVVEETKHNPSSLNSQHKQRAIGKSDGKLGANGPTVETRTVGWEPQCGCDEDVVPCVVLDPFIGSGTTAVVSIRHGRWCWGIDLSESYLRENAVPRIEGALFDLGLGGLVPRTKVKRSSLFDGGDDNA